MKCPCCSEELLGGYNAEAYYCENCHIVTAPTEE